MAMALTACGGGDQPASQPEASSEQPQSSQPAPQESSEEPPADSSEEEDARGYDALKGDGYEMKLGSLYYTLDSLEPDEAEIGYGMQGKYSLTEIDVVEGQEVEFYKDGEKASFFIDAEDDENKANTQERAGSEAYQGVHIRNDYVGAAIYFKVYSEANSIWITGYDSEYTPAPTETEYYVVGSFNGWAQKDATYKMTKSEENENVFEFKGLELGKNAEFKCTDNGSELTWYGANGTESQEPNVKVSEDGVYTVTLNLQPGEGEKYVSAVKTGDYEAPAADYFLVGTFNSWKQKDESYKLTVDSLDSNKYSIEVTFAEDASIKVMSSAGNWYGDNADGSGNGENIAVAAGTYKVTFLVEVVSGSHVQVAAAN